MSREVPELILRTCNKCGVVAYSTYELEHLFAKDSAAKLGYKCRCKECHSKETVKRNKLEKLKNNQKIKEYLGGSYKCADCGFEHEYIGIFDWHHLTQGAKEFQVSKILHHSWKKILKEISKCVFLCSNCHRLRHKA